MTHPENITLPADCLPGEVVAVLYFSDQKPLQGPAALLDWRLDGQLTKILLDGEVKGRAGEHVMLQSNGKLAAEWALFVGGGKWHGLSEETHASLVRHMLTVAQKAGFRELSLAYNSHQEVGKDLIARQVETVLEVEASSIERCFLACDAPTSVISS